MDWQKFCELFTYFNLVLLGICVVIALFIGIAWLICKIVDFVEEIKDCLEEYRYYKGDYRTKERETYFRLCDLQKQIDNLKKGSKKK